METTISKGDSKGDGFRRLSRIYTFYGRRVESYFITACNGWRGDVETIDSDADVAFVNLRLSVVVGRYGKLVV